VFLLLAGTLAIGHAIKAPCVHGDWSDGRQFTWLCHTDIIPLLGNEQLYGDRLPYLDPCEQTEGTCDEYPVLTIWMMRLTASVAALITFMKEMGPDATPEVEATTAFLGRSREKAKPVPPPDL
jgi:hypothetical protein